MLPPPRAQPRLFNTDRGAHYRHPSLFRNSGVGTCKERNLPSRRKRVLSEEAPRSWREIGSRVDTVKLAPNETVLAVTPMKTRAMPSIKAKGFDSVPLEPRTATRGGVVFLAECWQPR